MLLVVIRILMNALSQDGVTEYSLPSQNHVTVILKVCDADYLAMGCCKARRILMRALFRFQFIADAAHRHDAIRSLRIFLDLVT